MVVARACLVKVVASVFCLRTMDVDESLHHLAYGFVDGFEEAVPLWIMRDCGF